MTIKEFYEKYGDVELTEEQEKYIKEYLKIKDKRWKPEKGERYYYIDNWGVVEYIVFDNSIADNNRIILNNCFETEKDAKFRLEQIKVYNELKNFADENNDLNFDLNNNDTEKYHIKCLTEEKILDIRMFYKMKDIGQIYFSSKELAKQAIEKVGADRIKKYLFSVR